MARQMDLGELESHPDIRPGSPASELGNSPERESSEPDPCLPQGQETRELELEQIGTELGY